MEVLYPRCAGLDVHKATVVAAVRLVAGGKVVREVRTFATTTAGLLELAAWLAENGCTHVATEATGVCWKPVRHVLAWAAPPWSWPTPPRPRASRAARRT